MGASWGWRPQDPGRHHVPLYDSRLLRDLGVEVEVDAEISSSDLDLDAEISQ